MPTYATIADLRARVAEDELIQLTDDQNTGSADEARLATALEQADNLIDGYVGAIYKRIDAAAPLPPLLVDLACDIARFRLVRDGSPTEHVSSQHKNALKTLSDIAKGVIKLDQGEEQFESRDGAILTDSSPRIFSRPAMQGL